MTIKIVLVDDHDVVRDGIRRVRDAEPDLHVVASFDNGEDAVLYVEAEQPDVAIVDVAMPGMNGIEAARRMSDVLARTSTRSPLESLSKRERQILQMVAEGHISAQIAATLHLSPKTVDTYRSRLMQKLQIVDVAGLVKFAIRNGLTSPE